MSCKGCLKSNPNEDEIMIGTMSNPFSNFPGSFIDYGEPVWIEKVICKEPYVIVLWSDRTKTSAKVADCDTYSKEGGLALCILKRFIGTNTTKDLLATWTDENESIIDLKSVRKKAKTCKQ